MKGQIKEDDDLIKLFKTLLTLIISLTNKTSSKGSGFNSTSTRDPVSFLFRDNPKEFTVASSQTQLADPCTII